MRGADREEATGPLGDVVLITATVQTEAVIGLIPFCDVN